MTSQERIRRAYDHKEADRVPITDSPWAGTLARWKREGMPADADWRDVFDVDKVFSLGVDITPRYEQKILEETDEYQIVTTQWGVTLKNFKEQDSTPHFLDFKVNTPQAWEEAKARMTPTDDRIDWARIKEAHAKWRSQGAWINAGFWFGFDVTHSWMSGTDTILMAMLDDPEWFKDMVSTYLEMDLALFGKIWDAGYHFDGITWPDDMGYKGHTFFSNEIYAELLQPFHKRAIDWAHDRGIVAHMHSCGDIMERVPQLIEIGVDGLNPIEIKAGMDIHALKRDYGDKLLLHGGVNAQIFDQPDKVIPYIEDMLPDIKKNGGYIFSSDHSIPNSVSFDTYKLIVEAVKKLGAY